MSEEKDDELQGQSGESESRPKSRRNAKQKINDPLQVELLRRVEQVHDKVRDLKGGSQSACSGWLGLAKAVLKSWPLLVAGLVLVFYSPIKFTICALAEKLRLAHEVQFLGASFQADIKAEIARADDSDRYSLSGKLPVLGPDEIAFLLAIPSSGEILWQLEANTTDVLGTLWLAGDDTIRLVHVLSSQRLARFRKERDPTIRGKDGWLNADNWTEISYQDGSSLVAALRDKYGRHPAQTMPADKIAYKLDIPFPQSTVPIVYFERTDGGEIARNAILQAVEAQLRQLPVQGDPSSCSACERKN